LPPGLEKVGEQKLKPRPERERIIKMKHDGRIAAYHNGRGFGWIHGTDQNGRLSRYYFHISWVLTGDPAAGLPVKFIAGQNEKGFVAIEVEVGGAE
jgi:hypothetical protein